LEPLEAALKRGVSKTINRRVILEGGTVIPREPLESRTRSESDFGFGLLPELMYSGPFAAGQTTYSLFAILQGFSQVVYCAMTIQVGVVLR
jgi:hypothetical protein